MFENIVCDFLGCDAVWSHRKLIARVSEECVSSVCRALHLEDGGYKLFRNNVALQPTIPSFTSSRPREPQISEGLNILKSSCKLILGV
jgi:hypothetical protein